MSAVSFVHRDTGGSFSAWLGLAAEVTAVGEAGAMVARGEASAVTAGAIEKAGVGDGPPAEGASTVGDGLAVELVHAQTPSAITTRTTIGRGVLMFPLVAA